MNATADRLEFAPPPTPGLARALLLAIVAHALLMVALTAGLSWRHEAELVSAERLGQNIVYSLNATVAQETVAAVMALFKVGATARAKE